MLVVIPFMRQNDGNKRKEECIWHEGKQVGNDKTYAYEISTVIPVFNGRFSRCTAMVYHRVRKINEKIAL